MDAIEQENFSEEIVIVGTSSLRLFWGFKIGAIDSAVKIPYM